MATFRTEIFPSPSSFAIDHQSKIFTLGSCFAEVLGRQLLRHKFSVLMNPFGILYHPEAIFTLLQLQASSYEPHFLEREGLWFNYSFHSEIYGHSKKELLAKITFHSNTLLKYIQSCNVIVLTFGSTLGYRHKDSGKITGNCHKMPPSLFTKEFTDIENIEKHFDQVNTVLKKFNPSLEFILTVSPVRHIKETLVLNSASKSSLRLLCHRLSTKYPHVSYFPAYEIQMDDLRDYRFYKEDMIHPSTEAENYIWDKFINSYFQPETIQLVKDWQKILLALSHKPFHPHTLQHKKFLKETLKKIQELGKFIPVDEELLLVQRQLEN